MTCPNDILSPKKNWRLRIIFTIKCALMSFSRKGMECFISWPHRLKGSLLHCCPYLPPPRQVFQRLIYFSLPMTSLDSSTVPPGAYATPSTPPSPGMRPLGQSTLRQYGIWIHIIAERRLRVRRPSISLNTLLTECVHGFISWNMCFILIFHAVFILSVLY